MPFCVNAYTKFEGGLSHRRKRSVYDSGAGGEKNMKLTKGFIEAISRDYMKFLLQEAGKAVCLEKIMEQAEKFEGVQIFNGYYYFTPDEFAVTGGRDSDIKAVHYGEDAEYGIIRNMICYVNDGEVSSVKFTVDYRDESGVVKDCSLVNVTMEELYEEWSASELDAVGGIISIFEDFLDEHKIVVENKEKEDAALTQDEEELANIYGSDFGYLSDRLLVELGY